MFVKRHWKEILIALAVFAFIVAAAYQPSQKKPATNPFSIGQIVVAGANWPQGELEMSPKKSPGTKATIVDKSNYEIRVRFADGTEGIYLWWLFSDSKEVLPPEYWLLGNQFVVGQEICAIPSPRIKDFPSRGVIAEIKGVSVRLEGYESFNGYALYQQCR